MPLVDRTGTAARCIERVARVAPLLVLAALLACIQAPVSVDVVTDQEARLARVESFALVPPPWPHPEEIATAIEGQIRKSLEAKGLHETAPDAAEVAVSYRAPQKRGQRIVTIPDPDTAGYLVRQDYIEKTVEIDVFDAKTRKLLWRGIGRINVVSAQSLPAAAVKATREVLDEFPRS
jgi:hypothetical protein